MEYEPIEPETSSATISRMQLDVRPGGSAYPVSCDGAADGGGGGGVLATNGGLGGGDVGTGDGVTGSDGDGEGTAATAVSAVSAVGSGLLWNQKIRPASSNSGNSTSPTRRAVS